MSINDEFSKLFYSLSSENQDILENATTHKIYKKNEHLIEPGKDAGVAFAINTGIVRSYIIKSGNEITTSFNFDKAFCFPINSYIPGAESDEYFQALTDTVVNIIDVNIFNKLKLSHIELIQFEVYINEIIILQLAQRLREFQTLDAKERYLQLLEKEPNIIQNIPLTYIASYLGITLGSLSRIRSII